MLKEEPGVLLNGNGQDTTQERMYEQAILGNIP